MNVIGLSGSLRKGSLNTALLHSAAELMPAGATLTVRTIHGIPLYDGDVEATAYPPAATKLKDEIAAADGLLLVTPEYNNSIPGVFKNAIDWLSRPSNDIPRVFRNKPVAIIGASPGGFGTILSQNAWLPVLHTLGTRHFSGGRLMVVKATTLFDPAGQLTDDATRTKLSQFLKSFANFIDGATIA